MCRRQNVALGAIVLFQLYYLCFRKVFLKIQNVSDISASPLIDALIIVTYYAKVMVSIGKHFDDTVLNMVGVLILIHHNIFESVLIFQQYFLICPEKFQSVQKKIIKIHGVILLQLNLVFPENIVNSLVFKIIVLSASETFSVQPSFLAAADNTQQVLWTELLVVNI